MENSEEEDPYDYPFPLTLRSKTSTPGQSPVQGTVNGTF